MKIREIIGEAKEYAGRKELDQSTQHALPDAHIYPELDNSSGYMLYRFGVAMAGAPGEKMVTAGPTGLKMVTIGYTKADEEILAAAAKTIGTPRVRLTPAGSDETPDVNQVSPTAKPKRNKYGV